jgi:tagaturonate reductase
LVREVLKDSDFWGEDLSKLPGFEEAVVSKLTQIMHHGARETLKTLSFNKTEIV